VSRGGVRYYTENISGTCKPDQKESDVSASSGLFSVPRTITTSVIVRKAPSVACNQFVRGRLLAYFRMTTSLTGWNRDGVGGLFLMSNKHPSIRYLGVDRSKYKDIRNTQTMNRVR